MDIDERYTHEYWENRYKERSRERRKSEILAFSILILPLVVMLVYYFFKG